MNMKQYIGDGVYASVESGNLVITTENGLEVTNRIVMETEVLESLLVYLKGAYSVALESLRLENRRLQAALKRAAAETLASEAQ